MKPISFVQLCHINRVSNAWDRKTEEERRRICYDSFLKKKPHMFPETLVDSPWKYLKFKTQVKILKTEWATNLSVWRIP